jgi:adenosylmethionine-8-amino-7-oxononanoate aminotransferase
MAEFRFPDSPVFYRVLDRSLPEVVRGDGIYLYDAAGREYLDACGGALVVNIGHGRKEIASAMAEQASRVAYAHGTMFTTAALEETCAALVELLPGDLNKVYLVSGGAEATETAIKLARQYHLARGKPDKYRVIGLWPSYHGNTLAALSVGGRGPLRAPYEPLLSDSPHVPAPYCYRCPWKNHPSQCGSLFADELEKLLKRDGAEHFGAFIAEPISGSSAGAAVPPPEYFPRIREICDRYDLLFIADEVLTGLGRTGKYFAVEHFGVAPDILLLGKGLSGGYAPVGGVAVKRRLVEVIRDKFGNFTHGYTFSHHPVVAAACRATLAILKREELVNRVEKLGPHFLESLRRLERFPFVGDIRGRGLLAGIELVRDRDTKEPFPRSRRLVEEMTALAFQKGLLVYPSTGCADGVNGDIITLAPPFVIDEDGIDRIVERLEEAFSGLKT